jgi:haloalkane dehalogenase
MRIADYDRLPAKRVEVDGGEIFAVDVGDGPAVLLVHGSPVSSLEFRAVIDELRPRFRVVAPDLLSFGQSTGPPEGAGFTQQTRALRRFIDALGLDRFHLVVHDWGGAIGLGAAAEKPAQVDRVVLMNTSILPDFGPPLAWRPVIAPVVGEVALVGGQLMSFVLPVLLKAARQDPDLRERYLQPMARAATRRTILKLERRDGYGAVCRQIARALPRMGGPRLLLWGTPEPYFGREYRRLEASIPDLVRVTVPGAGHFAAEDAPDAVSRHIGEFLP